jgi:hypothetical protein
MKFECKDLERALAVPELMGEAGKKMGSILPQRLPAALKKHGIDFIGAQALWSDSDRLEIPARSLGEPQTQVIGRIGDVVWSAFITLRSDRIRIISVRRARNEEEAAYLQD